MTGRHEAPRGAQRRSGRVTETSDFVAFMTRLMVAFGDRVAQDPVALVHLRELQATLEQQTNRGIFEANKGQDHYSQNDMAQILGLTRQAVAHRIKLGELAHAALMQARGGGAVVRLAEVRQRRARLLEAAGVDDRTGSDRERGARAAGQ